jgi:hypothetical protein
VTRRRKLLLGGIAAVVLVAAAAFLAAQLRGPAASDCDTIRAMLADNQQFTDQTKESAKTNNPDLSTVQQYRDWAVRMKTYAAEVSDPALSAMATTAARLAAGTAEIVPKYRAKPEDPDIARQYARTGIEYGSAITKLEYACRL